MALTPAAARRRVGDAGDALGGRWAAYELVLRRLTADNDQLFFQFAETGS